MMLLTTVLYILFITLLAVCMPSDGGDVISASFRFHVTPLVLRCRMLAESTRGSTSRASAMRYRLEYVGLDFGIKPMLLSRETVGPSLPRLSEKRAAGCLPGNIFDVYLSFRVSGWMQRFDDEPLSHVSMVCLVSRHAIFARVSLLGKS